MANFKSGLAYDALRDIAMHIDASDLEASISVGSVFKSRDKWRGQLSYQSMSADGSTAQARVGHTLDARHSGRGAVSKAKAKKMMADWRLLVIEDVRKVSGVSADPTSPVRVCMAAYIDAKEAVGQIRKSTATNYRNAAKRIEGYPLANMPLVKLTTGGIQTMVNDMAGRLSGKSVKLSIDLLRAVCVKYLGRDHNPCEGLIMPKLNANAKQQVRRVNALTVDGVTRMNNLLDELDAKSDGTNLMSLGAKLALHTGVRAEEATGLRWRDVSFSARSIHIGNVIERAEVPKRDERGEVVRDKRGVAVTEYREYDAPPKTSRSERDIPLDAEMLDALAAHRKHVEEVITELFPKKKDRPRIDGLYVLGDLNGNHLSPRSLGKRWIKYARANKLDGTEGRTVTFHDLRHTSASRMIAAGVDVATVSALLGHAENSVTLNKYVTSDAKTVRAAVDGMAGIFGARKVEDADAKRGLAPIYTYRPTGTDN